MRQVRQQVVVVDTLVYVCWALVCVTGSAACEGEAERACSVCCEAPEAAEETLIAGRLSLAQLLAGPVTQPSCCLLFAVAV